MVFLDFFILIFIGHKYVIKISKIRKSINNMNMNTMNNNNNSVEIDWLIGALHRINQSIPQYYYYYSQWGKKQP